jgi:anti-sigma B factor antagonist
MFEIRREDDHIAVRGRWDATQTNKASVVLDTLNESTQLDLAALEYISSAGIGVLVKAQLRLQESGQELTLINVPQRVRAIFQFAGLEDFFGMA